MSMNPELLKDFDDRTVDECPLCEHEVARGEMGIHIEAAHRTDLQEMRTETADKVDPIVEQPTEPAAVDVKPADVTPRSSARPAPRRPRPRRTPSWPPCCSARPTADTNREVACTPGGLSARLPDRRTTRTATATDFLEKSR